MKMHDGAKFAFEAGFELKRMKRHLIFVKGRHLVVMPSTTASRRAIDNCKALVRRCQRGTCRCRKENHDAR